MQYELGALSLQPTRSLAVTAPLCPPALATFTFDTQRYYGLWGGTLRSNMPQWDHPHSFPYSIYACERPHDQAPELTKCEIHQPLRSDNHIRLLKVFPPGWPDRLAEKLTREEDNNIQCEIYQASLASLITEGRPYFATLSYAWGDPKPVKQIQCGNALVPIAQSLYDALVYIRHLRTPRLLWVYCLCIDQSNSDKKSRQVQRMHLVYGQGHCISWLGVESDRDRDLSAMLPILHWFSKTLQFFLDQRLELSLNNADVHLEHNPLRGLSNLRDLPWTLLHQCLNRDIFNRLWCAQETLVTRSNDLRTSHSRLDINVLARSCYLLLPMLDDLFSSGNIEDTASDNESLLLLRSRCAHIDRTLAGESSEGKPWSYIKYKRSNAVQVASAAATAMAMYSKECSDPRDRIYGIAGLCKFDPSYQISYSNTTLTVQQVFVDFTLHCLRNTKSLDLFQTPYRIAASRARNSTISTLQHRDWLPGLPSWCPDFAGPHRYARKLAPRDHGRISPLKACRGYPAHFTVLSRQCVAPMGVYIGSVKTSSSVWRGYNLGEDAAEWRSISEQIYASFQRCVSSIQAASPGCSNWKLLLNVFSAGVDFRHCPAWSYVSTFFPAKTRDRMVKSTIGAAWIMRHVPGLAPKGGLVLSRKLDADTWFKVAGDVDAWLWSKSECTRLFTTDNPAAVLGTGLDGIRVGDIVCVLFGSDVPFVLRPVGYKGDHKLIGQCYVEGIMHGEALDMGLEEREFRLV